MLGLKRGAVALYPHEKAWETEAQATMARLRQILGSVCIYRGVTPGRRPGCGRQQGRYRPVPHWQ